MDNHQWRLSQAYTYAFHISIHISITLIPYHLIFLLHVNLFLLHVLCLWHILYLYFFCIPISILYIFLYLSCVHLSRLSYVFFNVPMLFQVTYHVSSLCLFHLLVLRFIAFYVLLHILCTFLFDHILCAFVYFLYLSCVDLKQILSYHISIFRIT